MKYIRTKDGIFEKANQTIYKNEELEYIDDYELKLIIKQADTIEELCDCYIVIKNNRHSYYTKKQFNRTRTDHFLLARDVKLGKKIVYGAIWTNKGLIYVAKMNEKGELELL